MPARQLRWEVMANVTPHPLQIANQLWQDRVARGKWLRVDVRCPNLSCTRPNPRHLAHVARGPAHANGFSQTTAIAKSRSRSHALVKRSHQLPMGAPRTERIRDIAVGRDLRYASLA